jgi:hypothetical protein
MPSIQFLSEEVPESFGDMFMVDQPRMRDNIRMILHES